MSEENSMINTPAVISFEISKTDLFLSNFFPVFDPLNNMVQKQFLSIIKNYIGLILLWILSIEYSFPTDDNKNKNISFLYKHYNKQSNISCVYSLHDKDMNFTHYVRSVQSCLYHYENITGTLCLTLVKHLKSNR